MKTVVLYSLLATSALADSLPDKIAAEAVKQGVNPQLAIAIAITESGLNPYAKGSKGEIGLFQIMPYHYATHQLYDINTNIRIGILLLKRFQQQCSDMGNYWVICYNQGPKRRPRYPHLHPYYKQVSRHLEVANGR